MKRIRLPLLRASVIAACALAATASYPKVTPDDLKALDGQLTPMGAVRAASKDSGVPEWSGKWLGTPPDVQYKRGSRYPDPYASEKPVATITAENMAQYAEHLTDGQKAMFKRYPATYKIVVYPSHRDFRYPDSVYKDIRTYAPDSTMTPDANGLTNAPPTVPYPIPKTAAELLWNQRFSSSIGTEQATYDQAVVYSDGNIAWGKVRYDIYSPRNVGKYDVKSDLNNRTYYRNATELPLSDRGSLIVGFTNWDKAGADNSSRTWMYNPGTRRVRQAPEYGYDQPQGPGGFRTVDDDRLYNGPGDRYDWKIVGKREIYVPYNNYKVMDSAVKYGELLTKGHENPSYIRYELHRVWVLQATLKSGYRHQYAKRVLYIDEDSWQSLLADNYDARGQLWRTNVATSLYAYDAKVFYPSAVFFHDLISGAYMADRLTNEGPMPKLDNSPQFNEAYFSPDAIRSSGN
ncbi:DUF1329 domain-containing protein [Burkholderia cepacia]|uniref:DUF1329 domain-containing protein n=1 Tax=Burkholderia cepacia TaxID=292 RepID=UPI000752898D|nr:DUF1329 domain-containing protein [Burkholderia cepacia]KVA46978.1 hypothetical protein WI47_01960 [Burkholderia cepacia]KVC23706.1 hypothetical protein WI70_08380 [Burkholderia cepacia]